MAAIDKVRVIVVGDSGNVFIHKDIFILFIIIRFIRTEINKKKIRQLEDLTKQML